MTEKEYKEFMEDPNNSHSCNNCPENKGNFHEADLPCGQQNCWVDCHNW